MAISPEFIAAFTSWSNKISTAMTEAELIPQAEAKARELLEAEGKPLDREPISVAVTIAVAENAERIQTELNEVIGKMLLETIESEKFKRLSTKKEKNEAQFARDWKTFIEHFGQQSQDTCQNIVSQYSPNPSSLTFKFLNLKQMRKYCEQFLFMRIENDEAKGVKVLLTKYSEYYITLQKKVKDKLQALRDNQERGSSKLTKILKQVYDENPPEMDSDTLSTFKKVVQNNMKEVAILALHNDLHPYISAWLGELAAGNLQLFSQTTDSTKGMVLAAAHYCSPKLSEDALAELRAALGLSEAVMSSEIFGQRLDEFQEHIPLQEKYFTLLSLVLLFSGGCQVLAARGRPRCHPQRRHFCRSLVLRLLTRDEDIFPENEWILVHHIEDLISHFLQPEHSSSFVHLLLDEWNSSKSCCEMKLRVFNFDPLTPGLYPGLHVTIAISGWMSEGTNMLENWKSIVTHMHYGAVYALNWESGTTAGEASKGVLEVAGTIGAAIIPVIGVVTGPIALYSLWKHQPFQTAAERAEETGRCLAHHIKSYAFGNVSISIVCFSLGARVAAFCLEELASEDTKYVQDVVLFGGAMSVEGWENRKRAVSGQLINVWSREDDVLKYAYRTARFEEPVGLNPIDVAGVINFNASKSVFGHADHKSKFDKSMTSINYIP